MVPSGREKAHKSLGQKTHCLSVIADLLGGLPEAERRGVIAELPLEQRAAIARLIARRNV